MPELLRNRSRGGDLGNMNKKIRELKVVRHFSHKPVASLPLKGKWLEEAGFSVGIQVNVVVRKDCLVILAPCALER